MYIENDNEEVIFFEDLGFGWPFDKSTIRLLRNMEGIEKLKDQLDDDLKKGKTKLGKS